MSDAEKSILLSRIFNLSSPSPYVSFSFSIRSVVMSSLVLVLLIGTGTASAAQDSAPGDLLYPIKVSVNEKIESALARGPAARAEVYAKFAERRLDEAQQLASRGALDAQKEAELEARFAASAASAQEFAEVAEAQKPGIAVGVKIKLEASADARGRILARIGGGKDDETRDRSIALAQKVRSISGRSVEFNGESGIVAVSTTAARDENHAAQDAERDEMSEKAAMTLRNKATRALKDAREKFKDAKALDDATSARVDEQFALADKEISSGEVQFDASAYAEAALHYTGAFKIGIKLSALLEAHKKFDGEFILPILDEEKTEMKIQIPKL